jgi:hypothetical protein
VRSVAVVALVLAGLVATGCGKSVARELESAKTPTEEAHALERVSRECAPLTLTVEDATGNPLPLSGPRFPMDARRVHVGGKCTLDHTLLEPKNVFLLLGE